MMALAKHFLLRCVNDIRLLIQYRQYTHRRFATLVGASSVLWLFYCLLRGLVNTGYLYKYPTVDHWCDKEELPSYFNVKDPEEITIVTGFFNLGLYKNGPSSLDYSNPFQQKQWMRPLGRVANPVVAYFEDERDAAYFKEIRSCLPEARTQVIIVERKELWTFHLQPQYQRVYEKPGYPLHYPNTANADHTAASHSKYELLRRAVKKNRFHTPFLAWLDSGYFRNLDGTNFDLFKIVPPGTFNTDMVSMTQAYPHDPNIPAKEVIAHNLVWVSGEMLLGTGETLLNFTQLYRQTVEHLLKNDISGGDEQVIYLMYSTPLRRPKQVMIKTYLCHEGQLGLYGMDTRYLCLGYVAKNAWDKIHKPGV